MELGDRDPWSRLLAVALLFGRRSAYIPMQFWIDLDILSMIGPRWICAMMFRSLALASYASRPSSTWTWIAIIGFVS